MTPARLILVVVAGVAVAAGVAASAPGAAVLWGVQIATQALAVSGCVMAAAVLSRRDLLLGAWLGTGLSFLVPALTALGRGPSGQGPLAGLPPGWISVGGGALMDGAAVAGAALFVVAYRRSGLTRLPSSRRGVAISRVTIGVGLAAGAALLWLDATAALRHGDAARGFADGLAAVADATCFALAGPLLRIALSFRGGRLAAPWAFLAACNLGWLAYDGANILTQRAPAGTLAASLTDLVASASCLTAMAAGLAFRSAVTAPAPSAPGVALDA